MPARCVRGSSSRRAARCSIMAAWLPSSPTWTGASVRRPLNWPARGVHSSSSPAQTCARASSPAAASARASTTSSAPSCSASTYHYGVQTIDGYRYGYEGLNLATTATSRWLLTPARVERIGHARRHAAGHVARQAGRRPSWSMHWSSTATSTCSSPSAATARCAAPRPSPPRSPAAGCPLPSSASPKPSTTTSTSSTSAFGFDHGRGGGAGGAIEGAHSRGHRRAQRCGAGQADGARQRLHRRPHRAGRQPRQLLPHARSSPSRWKRSCYPRCAPSGTAPPRGDCRCRGGSRAGADGWQRAPWTRRAMCCTWVTSASISATPSAPTSARSACEHEPEVHRPQLHRSAACPPIPMTRPSACFWVTTQSMPR
jgi:hypothetical protein